MTEPSPPPKISITDFRRNLSRHVNSVRFGGDAICIRRRNEDNVYLISQAD